MIVTSSEDGSIRVWQFIESFSNSKKQKYVNLLKDLTSIAQQKL
jgi:hypothetical protein